MIGLHCFDDFSRSINKQRLNIPQSNHPVYTIHTQTINTAVGVIDPIRSRQRLCFVAGIILIYR